jgi:hypothetical protein
MASRQKKRQATAAAVGISGNGVAAAPPLHQSPPPSPPQTSLPTPCFDLYVRSSCGFISLLFDPQKLLLRRLFFLD